MGPLTRVADRAIGIGMGGTIVLGIWLAFSVGGYDIWDGWIIAALVLWLIAGALGQRMSAAYARGEPPCLRQRRREILSAGVLVAPGPLAAGLARHA